MTGPRPDGCRGPDFAAILNNVTLLQTDRGFRDGGGLFFIEGVRNFVRAIEHCDKQKSNTTTGGDD